MYTARVWIRHARGPGTLTFLFARASMLDTADAQTLRETGFKISLNAPGLQSVGVDFPPGMLSKFENKFACTRLHAVCMHPDGPGGRCMARGREESADNLSV